jgi:hypothetical protein
VTYPKSDDLASSLGIKAKSSACHEFAAAKVVGVRYCTLKMQRKLTAMLGGYFPMSGKGANHTLTSKIYSNILSLQAVKVKEKAQKIIIL